MKKCLFLTVALTLSVFSLFTTSCDNNDEPNVSKPVATLAEVGEENSKTATAGKDMHLEGNLEAEGLIARIDVAVTPADGLTTVVAKSWTDGKYIGVRNTTFHEHIDISSETAAGEYVLTFTVTDKAGQSSVFKSSLKITTPVEGSPEITITETGEGNSKTAVAGGEMHLEAEISAPNKIAEIEVELHNTAADYEKEFKYTGKYLGETSAHFHEHLAVPADAPAGEYHLHFTVTDAEGNSTTEEVEGIQITK